MAACVVAGAAWVLRWSTPSHGASRPNRGRLALRAGVLLLGVGALLLWLHVAGKPSVTVKNDTSKTIEVQLCPGQECSGGLHEIKPGGSRRFGLDGKAIPLTPDSLRLTSGSELVGCILVDRDPPMPKHLRVSVSEADLPTC